MACHGSNPRKPANRLVRAHVINLNDAGLGTLEPAICRHPLDAFT